MSRCCRRWADSLVDVKMSALGVFGALTDLSCTKNSEADLCLDVGGCESSESMDDCEEVSELTTEDTSLSEASLSDVLERESSDESPDEEEARREFVGFGAVTSVDDPRMS